jgi:uroporphyrinogen-III decarboxylase
MKTAAEASRMLSKAAVFIKDMEALGFGCQYGSGAYAPFDYIGDFFRGTRGIMLDMYRVPEKLLEVLEKVTTIIIQGALAGAKITGNPYVFMPMHKGLDGFMSLDQFKTFFWPQLRKIIVTLIEKGLTPLVLWEGNCDSRLETIGDIPKGKAVYWFERSDIFKAKEILGDTVCLRGNVPPSLLSVGSAQEVRDYCKKLIDKVGKGGGFIMDGATPIPDEAKPENVKAMAETTREYGVYG